MKRFVVATAIAVVLARPPTARADGTCGTTDGVVCLLGMGAATLLPANFGADAGSTASALIIGWPIQIPLAAHLDYHKPHLFIPVEPQLATPVGGGRVQGRFRWGLRGIWQPFEKVGFFAGLGSSLANIDGEARASFSPELGVRLHAPILDGAEKSTYSLAIVHLNLTVRGDVFVGAWRVAALVGWTIF